ncbi:hypothetical protein BD414DRAFT_408423 [Trametes punicea]|nr:hypothetical protein BD414DRAFT_408423 [Trametes punicea]
MTLCYVKVPSALITVPFGVTYEKIGTIQRRLAWPLHKDDTLSRSGRPTGLKIYLPFFFICAYTEGVMASRAVNVVPHSYDAARL